ncbi:MAG: hypothetical protein M1296_03175 [Chloroflexi bacterium]|nr:hypothetical protein [Chloroflexota bacterium]
MKFASLIVTLLSVFALTACDIFDSIPRPQPDIHMFGDALDAVTFQKVDQARITIRLDHKTLHFTGAYDIEVAAHDPIRITVTAPGYRPYEVDTTLQPQASNELRSPLMLQRKAASP